MAYFVAGDPIPDLYEGDVTRGALKAFATELAGGCYEAKKMAKCSAEQKKQLEQMETDGVETVRAKFLGMRRELSASREGLRSSMEEYQDRGDPPGDRGDEKASAGASSADSKPAKPPQTPEERKRARAEAAAVAQQKMLLNLVKRDKAITLGKSQEFLLLKTYLAAHGASPQKDEHEWASAKKEPREEADPRAGKADKKRGRSTGSAEKGKARKKGSTSLGEGGAANGEATKKDEL